MRKEVSGIRTARLAATVWRRKAARGTIRRRPRAPSTGQFETLW